MVTEKVIRNVIQDGYENIKFFFIVLSGYNS
jgi:hypothetical protein